MSYAPNSDMGENAAAFEEADSIPAFITTSIAIGKSGGDKLDGAIGESARIGWEFVSRAQLSGRISDLDVADVLVFEESGVSLRRYCGGRAANSMRFHPSSSLLRLKSIADGGKDAFVEALDLLPGDSFLDCTMGLGSNSIVASSVVSAKGRVLALEASKAIFEVVDLGMRAYKVDGPVEAAISRIERRHADFRQLLGGCPERSFDIVYMDPMFTEPFAHATPMDAIRAWSVRGMPGAEDIRAAFRAAKRRFVMKVSKGEDLSFICRMNGYRVFHSGASGAVEYVGFEKAV